MQNDTRGRPLDAAAELTALLHALDTVRRHVIAQVEALSKVDRRTARLPSGWTPLGLVRHLTLSDERYWFEVVIDGGSLDYWPEGEDGDWRVPAGTPDAEVLAEYRSAIAASDAILHRHDLDASPLRPEPEWAGTGSFADVRTIVLHVIIETSAHAGQLDAVRELADGGQYIVL